MDRRNHIVSCFNTQRPQVTQIHPTPAGARRAVVTRLENLTKADDRYQPGVNRFLRLQPAAATGALKQKRWGLNVEKVGRDPGKNGAGYFVQQSPTSPNLWPEIGDLTKSGDHTPNKRCYFLSQTIPTARKHTESTATDGPTQTLAPCWNWYLKREVPLIYL